MSKANCDGSSEHSRAKCPIHILQKLGERVREERKKKGWSQEVLSAYSGVSEDTISRLENGTSIKFDNLYAITQCLQLSCDFPFSCLDARSET